jgi:hypothetical protein
MKFLLCYSPENPNEIVDRVPVQEKPPLEDELLPELDCADYCYICRRGDNDASLLLCDRCNFEICHLECCGLETVPEGDWFCRSCIDELK